MDLTNRQLAENETWVVAEMWAECPFCGFLSRDLDLGKPSVPCPYCKRRGRPRIVFPDISSTRLLEMISYFYAKAWERVDDTGQALAEELRKKLAREYSVETAVRAACEAQELRACSKGTQADFDRLLGAIQEFLDLKSAKEARKAYVPLLEYTDTHEEHQVVVLLTTGMLERLFGQLLLRMFVKLGNDWEKARSAVKALRGQRERESVFAGIAGASLEEAITKSGFSSFYAMWRETRERRNRFIHGLPFVIHVSDAEKAFELAKEAFAVFAHLHNASCVTSPDLE